MQLPLRWSSGIFRQRNMAIEKQDESSAPHRLSQQDLVMARQYSETSARVSVALQRQKKGKAAEGEKLADLKRELEMWEHKVTVEELCKKLSTITNGLSTTEAKDRLTRNGPNILSPPKVTPWYVKLFKQFFNFFAILLQVGSILCFVSYFLDNENIENLYLGAVLYAVVVITSIFTYLQEAKSEKTMEKFKNLLPPKSVARRDGQLIELPAADLVIGDVIEVKLGDKIPADIRIIENHNLKVENSPLTGESEPVARSVDCTDENPLETNNLAFFGTLAVDGTCVGVVVKTGDDTLFGRIAGLAAGASAEVTTLQVDIHHFIVLISTFAIFFGVVFFIYGLARGTPIISNVVFAIGLIVANVPEGLLATVTVSLTLSAKRLAKKNVLVKKLESVETLGSTTCICSDKTGTLTQNRMSVSHLVYNCELHSARTAATKATYSEEDPCFKELYLMGALCSKAVFDAKDIKENPEKSIDDRKVNGDASESGILKFCEKISSVQDLRQRYPQIGTVPFNSANKFMVTINNTSTKGWAPRVYMKGAPERVISRCSNIITNQGAKAMDKLYESTINKHLMKMMNEGERCLGFAMLDLDPLEYPKGYEFDAESMNFPITGLTFVGMISLLDPPREAVPGAVLTCLQAGVKVIMVTGDHPATAKSIAKQVNIIQSPTAEDIAEERGIPTDQVDQSTVKSIVVPGSVITDMEVADWDRVLAHEQIVFARTSPQQKLIIVENVQRLGNIVAVTGDGVNDSPALKKANIGVAMGIAGSDVSKEAADMILLDDNFASIVAGVEEGRLIFDNLKKSIAYVLTHNPPEITPFLAFIILRIPLPMTTVLVLCIDIGTDIVPAISLAYENAELDIMTRKPRNAKVDRMVNRRLISFAYLQIGIVQCAAGFFTYLVIWNDYGISPGALIGLDSRSYIESPAREDKRWLYAERARRLRPSIAVGWFDNEDGSEFSEFFSEKKDGFMVQNGDTTEKGLKSNSSGVIFDSTLQNDAQRFNMFKILAVTTLRPPCVRYSCVINGALKQNSYSDCVGEFTEYESGIVINNNVLAYDYGDDIYHKTEVEGTGEGEGCFDMYTVSQVEHSTRMAQTAFFVSIVIMQIGGILICKSRTLSLFQHGMRNWVLNFSILSEILLCCCITYLPFIRSAFGTGRLRFVHWLPAVPFSIFIFCYDEIRKAIIRSGERNGNKLGVWMKENTYW